MSKPKEIKKKCKDCRYSITHNDLLYCEIRLQHKNVPKPSGRVDEVFCDIFREKIT